ncbi:hypothetical protein WSM22_12420 [Cytophagales bacterium WSM2-2]|nr:hypothetical protein WSM22_12420 [Cytophagales bacterium WSM2-2]
MKQISLLKTAFLLLVSTGSIYVLLNLSGCTDIAGIDTDYKKLCGSKITLEGPATLFVEPCDPQDVTYNVFVDGVNIIDPTNKVDWGFKWIVSGDIQIISAPTNGPIIIRATQPKGFGTITLMGFVDGECHADEGSELRTWATLTIGIQPNTIDIEPHLCTDLMGQVLTGSFSVKDSAPGLQDYIWNVTPVTAADISPMAGTPTCNISNIKADFTISVAKVGKTCTTTPVAKFVQLSSLTVCP